MSSLDLLVTLWPSFPHFPRFSQDQRVAGIRLNSAMIDNPQLEQELALVQATSPQVPLWFDVKGRQLRITDLHYNPDYLDISLNHQISVVTPTPVIFKAGADGAILDRLEEGGSRLIFRGGPRYLVRPGESLHIRHPSLEVHGDLFTKAELEKIEKVRRAGFTRFFLSYVENQYDVDQFLELVGPDTEVWLKIENQKGLNYVANEFRKKPNLVLVAARGDLYVEIDRPHQIMEATRLIIKKDPEACVGSRLLLSVIHEPIPSCSDLSELAWLYDIGYRKMMLCDEICLKEDLLATAINVFDDFRRHYP